MQPIIDIKKWMKKTNMKALLKIEKSDEIAWSKFILFDARSS